MKQTLIDSFSGEYDFLSNFYMIPLVYEGINYTNSEAAFQAAKIFYPGDEQRTKEERMTFCSYSPSMAKKMGRRAITLRSDWESVKDGIMLDIIRAKFGQNPHLRRLLIETGEAVLVEGNTWHDCYWGDCHCPKCQSKPGKNMLGKLLMKVRNELKQ